MADCVTLYELAGKELFGRKLGDLCTTRKGELRAKPGEARCWINGASMYLEDGVVEKDPQTGLWQTYICCYLITEGEVIELARLAGDHAVMRKRRLAAGIGMGWPPLRDFLHASLHQSKGDLEKCPGRITSTVTTSNTSPRRTPTLTLV